MAADPAFAEFASVFERFQSAEAMFNPDTDTDASAKAKPAADDAAAEGEAEEGEGEKMSRKKARRLKRLSIAELKQLVAKPEVVEQWDVTAADPRLLVMLKSYRNCVPVPKHWCQKRHFLQGKRGVEKPPFKLPEFIEATGIAKIRAAVMEREAGKKLKSKQKERVQPKMGKIDIDYQVLHDAFFKYQTKPVLTGHGDVYFEGKEFEVALRQKKPGSISEELRKALQMGDNEPPPWLVNMQRYGPPPSYPSLKIPGLNAPIPEGTSYGYHPGGWGKPPVDEFGRPLYGDVFGTAAPEVEAPLEVQVSQELWGEMDPEEEYEEDEDEEDEEDGTAGDDASMTDGEIEAGISSVSSAPSGIATPDSVHLRKLQNDGLNTPSNQSLTGTETPDSLSGEQQLYQVLEQRDSRVGGSAFGSSHAYNVPGGAKGKAGAGRPGVDLALDPAELDKLDAGALKAKYDELRKAEQAANAPEDVSDIIEEQERKRRKKLDAAKDKKSGSYKF
jgi:splicing factor 3B subunit 2